MNRYLAALFLLLPSLTWADPPGTEPAVGIRQRPPTSHSLVHVRLIPEPGKVVEDATIVIRDGRIVSIKASGPPLPGSRVWDLSGKQAYAGLIDAYSTQSLDTVTSGSAHWNSYIQPQRRVADQYSPDSSLDQKLRRQGVTARLVAPSSGIIKGVSALVTTNNRSREDSLIQTDVAQHIRLTVPFSRTRGQYPNSPMGAVALARQVLSDATWYDDAWQRHQNSPSAARPKRDDALAALQSLLSQKQIAIFDTNNELFCLRAKDFADEHNLRGILNGSGYEYRRLGEIHAIGMPVIVPVDFPLPPNVSTPEDSLSVSLSQLMHWDFAPENPGRLAAAGVEICFTSSGLNDQAKFLEQIRVAVERGLTADAALAALTTVPAKLFGVGEHLGRVRPGYAAHLVVTDGDLFGKTTKVSETWIDGERFEIVNPPKSVASNWTTQWTLADTAQEVSITLTGTTTKPGGELSWKPAGSEAAKKIKLTKLRVLESQMAFAFRGESLGVDGIVRFSATRSVEGDDVRWHGTLGLPDGTLQSTLVQRAAPSDVKKEDEKKETNKEATRTENRVDYAVNYPFGAYGRKTIPEQPKVVLFTNATIWTSGPQGIIRKGSLLVENGVIKAIGRDIPTPPGALVVDVSGKHISPGIIDCHSHMATDGGVNESAQANTAEVRIGDFIDCDDVNIYRQLAGGVTSSNILHGSANPIGGQNQVIKLRWGLNPNQLKFAGAPQGIKFALGENVKKSNVDSPEARTRYPQTRMGVEQFFRDNFEAAKIYQAKFDAWQKNPQGLPPRRDLELEAISEIIQGERWIHCHSYRQDEILALIRLLDEFEITIGTFQHILEGYKVAKEMAEHGQWHRLSQTGGPTNSKHTMQSPTTGR